jgi:arsenate reductase
MGKSIVLILCTGNSARSQMAEALLREKAGQMFDVQSAGTEPAAEVNPLAIEALREIGIDISGNRPKDVGTFLGKAPVRHLIIVCADADRRCPSIWPGVASRVQWPIEDPAAFKGDPGGALQKFRDVRDELSKHLDGWLAEMIASTRSEARRHEL